MRLSSHWFESFLQRGRRAKLNSSSTPKDTIPLFCSHWLWYAPDPSGRQLGLQNKQKANIIKRLLLFSQSVQLIERSVDLAHLAQSRVREQVARSRRWKQHRAQHGASRWALLPPALGDCGVGSGPFPCALGGYGAMWFPAASSHCSDGRRLCCCDLWRLPFPSSFFAQCKLRFENSKHDSLGKTLYLVMYKSNNWTVRVFCGRKGYLLSCFSNVTVTSILMLQNVCFKMPQK